MVQGGLAGIGFANRGHSNRRHRAGGRACGFQCAFQRDGIHHSGEHAHRISGGPVNPASRTHFGTTDNITAADHHGQLDPRLRGFGQIGRERHQCRRVQPITIRSQKCFAGQFDQDAFELCHGAPLSLFQKKGGSNAAFSFRLRQAFTPAAAATSAAKSLSCFSMPSPRP